MAGAVALGEVVRTGVALGVDAGEESLTTGEVGESAAGITSEARDWATKSALSVNTNAATHLRDFFPGIAAGYYLFKIVNKRYE
jgi:hypothetical protein